MTAIARPSSRTRLRPLRPSQVRLDVGLAVALLLLGVAPVGWDLYAPGPVVLVTAAAAVAIRRLQPAVALALVWVSAALQLVAFERPSVVQVASVIVLYTAASRGRRTELWASGVSAVLGAAIATPYLAFTGFRFAALILHGPLEQRVGAALLPLALLGSAWLAGFAVRQARSRRAEVVLRSAAEVRADRAQETADLERFRSVMAREVHDVVGHSLAVIIAQADAAEVTEDPARVRGMVADIARTARSSLDEVRSVLERTGTAAAAAQEEGLDEVLDRVRATGAALEEHETGTPVLLPPPVALVVRRLLQEMLTNALRHGRPGGAIRVLREWRATALILETANPRGALPKPGSGRGLDGMRSRLDAIGGTLETDVVGDDFLVRARIPLVGGTGA